MALKRIHIILILLLLLISCSQSIENVAIPEFEESSQISSLEKLSNTQASVLEGIYELSDGKNEFGSFVAVKSIGNSISIFASKNSAFCILECGKTDSSIIFEGYWRYAANAKVGLIRLVVMKGNGFESVINSEYDSNIKITGTFGENKSYSEKVINLSYIRKLSKPNIEILSHRAGARNIDRLGISENTVEMLKFCEKLGATGTEIDIQLTKDKIPVLFHDKQLNSRLINENYVLGEIEDYNLSQLKNLITFKNGERISTLKEALETVIYETNLTTLWLDVKSPESVKIICQLIDEYENIIVQKQRNLEIYIGVPDENIFQSLKIIPNYAKYNIICELDENTVIENKFAIWAPRWSLGLLNDKIPSVKEKGIRVFIWTLDDRIFMKKYIASNNFEGILTNYPSVLAYEVYSQE